MGLNISTITKAGSGIISGVEKLFSSGKATEVAKSAGKSSLSILKSVGKGAVSVGGLAVSAGVSGTKSLLSGLSSSSSSSQSQSSGILSNVLKLGAVFGILKLLSNSSTVKNITDNISAIGNNANQASNSNNSTSNSNNSSTSTLNNNSNASTINSNNSTATSATSPLDSKDSQVNIATYRSNVDNGAQKSLENMQNTVAKTQELQNQNEKSPSQVVAQQQSQLEM